MKEIMKRLIAYFKKETVLCIAANLGSMMTPVGNPQNLYLYSVSGMGQFLMIMGPLSILFLSAMISDWIVS